MAFEYTITNKLEVGNVKVVYGNFSNDGDSEGGTIEVKNMHYILNVVLQHTGASVVADSPAVNGTLIGKPPRINGNTVEIVVAPNSDGLFIITGV